MDTEHTFPLPEAELHKLEDMASGAKDKVRSAMKKSVDAVKSVEMTPLMWVGLAGLVGGLAAFMWKRR